MQLIFIPPFALFLYFVSAAFLKLPSFAEQRAAAAIRRKEQSESKVDTLVLSTAKSLARFVPMSTFTKEKLTATLAAAGITDRTPQEFMVVAYIKAAAVLLLCIPCLFVFPFAAIVVVLYAVKVYAKEAGQAEQLLADRKRMLVAELPRFAATISAELQNSRDVLSILDIYKETASEPLKGELAQTVSDMRSGSYEQALSRLEIRCDLSEISEIVRGLVSVLRGDDGKLYFAMLARTLRSNELARLKKEAMAISPKIRRCAQVLLVFFIGT